MTPHPGYRRLWLVMHGLGLVAVHTGYGVWYWSAFALLEAVALLRLTEGRLADGTFSWAVWSFLADGTGFAAAWRLGVVVLWAGWFEGTWLIYSPMPDPWKGVLGAAFVVWIVAHFFGRRSDG